MSQEELFINGDLLRLRREAQGWALSDMAIRACMSVKQIRQLEEGGISAFYSPAVKATAAKKVGGLLGVSAEEVFGLETPDISTESTLEESLTVGESVPNVSDVVIEHSELISVPDSEPIDLVSPEDKKSKTSLWVIAGLFAAALAVAAYMQPQEEPATEPVPPLQVVPSDAADAASASEFPASNASSAEVAVIPAVRPASLANVSSVPVGPASKVTP